MNTPHGQILDHITHTAIRMTIMEITLKTSAEQILDVGISRDMYKLVNGEDIDNSFFNIRFCLQS